MVAEQKYISKEIYKYLEEHGTGRENLLPLLHHMQTKYNFLGEFILREIARGLNISPAEVYGVATFYSFFATKRRGKYVIRICRTIACDMANKDRIVRLLENELGIKMGETTEDNKFTLEYTNCIGMCNEAPAMLINDKVYSKLTPAKLHKIIEDYKGGVYA